MSGNLTRAVIPPFEPVGTPASPMTLLEALGRYGPGVRFLPSAELRANVGRELALANQCRMERGEPELHLLQEGEAWWFEIGSAREGRS
jgi:hypothetical protein